MEAIIFIGLQASGKSTFYKNHFFNSHIRISNDLLKTKNRVSKFLQLSIETKMKIVIDNTNFSKETRQEVIEYFKKNEYKIIGYYFKLDVSRSLEWNKKRPISEIIPDVGILGTYKKMEKPSYNEGYDKLYYVDFIDDKLTIKDWTDEI